MTYTFLPQPKTITHDILVRGIISSFPPGPFNLEPGSNLYALVEWIADGLLPIYQDAQKSQDALNPGKATDATSLTQWQEFALRADCYDLPNLTEAQRRELVIAALRGGNPTLTRDELHTKVSDAFPSITFNTTMEFLPLRFGADDLNGDSFANSAWVRISVPNTVGDSDLKRIQCYVGTILPSTTAFAVVREV